MVVKAAGCFVFSVGGGDSMGGGWGLIVVMTRWSIERGLFTCLLLTCPPVLLYDDCPVFFRVSCHV